MANKRSGNSSNVNWSALYPEMLVLISKNLPDVFDFVHFRATCRSWRSATLAMDKTFQVPWVTRIRDFFLKGLFFYRLVSSESISEIKISGLFDDKKYYGMSCWQGYLLVANDTSSMLSLINPLTNREISLPLLYDLKNQKCSLLGIETNNEGIPEFVAIHANLSRSSTLICFCHIGDKNWTVGYNGGYRPFSTCKYYKSKFHSFCSHKSEIEVYNAKRSGLVIHKFAVPQNFSCDVSYFHFCIDEGGLLGIVLRSYDSFHDIYFEVYRLEYENGSAQWIRTTNIGNQIIYVTDNDCQISKAVSLSTFQRNNIYFISTLCRETYMNCVRKFDIEKGTIEDVHFSPDGYGWFLPSLV